VNLSRTVSDGSVKLDLWRFKDVLNADGQSGNTRPLYHLADSKEEQAG
jgi:hypothetical protein